MITLHTPPKGDQSDYSLTQFEKETETDSQKIKDFSTNPSLFEHLPTKTFHKAAKFYMVLPHQNFEEVTLDLNPQELTLSGNGSEREPQVIPLSDVLGASFKEEKKLNKQLKVLYPGAIQIFRLTIYLLEKPRRKSDNSIDYQAKRKYKKLRLYQPSSEFAAKWRNMILQAANNPNFLGLVKDLADSDELPAFKRRLLVFISPNSGLKRGGSKWAKARKLLVKGGCDFIEIHTKYAGHAKMYCKDIEAERLIEIDGIITVSGDGGVHEILNGLLSRPDYEQFKDIPIGVIPSGTCNSLIKNINERGGFHGTKSTKEACHLIVKGKSFKSDVTMLETMDKKKIYFFIILSWATFAAIDLESKKMRMLGKTRFTISGLWNILKLKKYKGKISYTTTDTELPDINEELKGEEWQTIPHEKFTNFSIHNLPWISENHQPLPFASFHDGYNHMLELNGEHAKRIQLGQSLASLKGHIFRSGRVKKHLGVGYHKIKAFRIEPYGNHPGYYDIDGEGYKAGKIQGRVLEQAVTFYSP